MSSSNDENGSATWPLCWDLVISKMLSDNESHYADMWEITSKKHDWNQTATLMIEGVAAMFHQASNALRLRGHQDHVWGMILKHFTNFLRRQVQEVNTAAFLALTKMLTDLEYTSTSRSAAIEGAWNLWKDGMPVYNEEARGHTDRDSGFVAYLQCLQELLRLIQDQITTEQIGLIMEQVHACVIQSSVPAYSTDVDQVTPVQELSLLVIGLISPNLPGTMSILIETLANYVILPYVPEKKLRGQTFVALSKGSIDMLESNIVTRYFKRTDAPDVDSMRRALSAIVTPLGHKANPMGKEPYLWMKASAAALTVLRACIPAVKAQKDGQEHLSEFWEEAIRVADGIFSADCDSYPSKMRITTDQVYDIASFERLQKLLIPTLGSASVSDGIRRKYADCIFHNSVIHEPHPDDLAQPDQELLHGLQSTHIGRVQNLPPSPRSKMSYLLLDELFKLVAVHDGSPERVRLAQAAAPYLILRVGLVLKAYTLDQPLRGRMPQPMTQKTEMLYILRKLVELDSEPKAIPDAPSVSSEHKKHLHRLYGLAMRALKAARRDEEMKKALMKVLDVVGAEFGF